MNSNHILPYNKSRRLSSQHGFALVIALSLMAFVLLLLLSITTLVQVETTSAEIAKTRLVAQQNALTGALTALGELQQHCGVDQRSTASAGITDSDSTTSDVDDVAHPQWMGVWRYDEGSETKELVTWLISGNQDKTSTTLLDPVDKLGDEVDRVRFPSSPFANSANAADYVEAPIVYMDEDDKSDGFAYWVSGQQEKADVGIALPTVDPLPASIEGAEVLGGQYSLPALGFNSPDLDPSDPDLAKVSGLFQLPLINGVVVDDDTTQLEASAAALGAGNFGLLTNARDGGLRTDLTSKLEKMEDDDDELLEPWVDLSSYSNSDGTPIPTPYDNPDDDAVPYTTASPTWGKLKAFYDLKDDMLADGELTPQPSTDQQPGLSPRIAMCSLAMATGTEADTTIELLLQPKVVLHNPYNVPLALQKYMINFFGLAPRFEDSEGHPQNDTRSGRIVYFNNYTYWWANPDGFSTGKHRRQIVMDLKRGDLPGTGNRQSVADDNALTRQRADGLGTAGWGSTKDYPPGAPRFEIDCDIVMQPGEAIVFMPPAVAPGTRNTFDRMAPANLALKPGFRPDSYYRYPTSPKWRMFDINEDDIVDYLDLVDGNLIPIPLVDRKEDWFRVGLWDGTNIDVGYFDATLSLLEDTVDQKGEQVAPLFYHNGERRSYVARQANAAFEDRIFQTTGRIEHNYTRRPPDPDGDYIHDGALIKYNDRHPINPGVNTVAWHALAYDPLDPPDGQAYNPYKYFNPRAKIMERSDLKTRQDNSRKDAVAVINPTENYFYEVEISSVDPSGFVVLDYYGSGDSKVRIGGGLRSPIADTMVLYDVPSDGTGLYSLGQLQHFQLSDYFDEAGYAIGNSLRSPHLAADELIHKGLGVVSWLDDDFSDPSDRIEGTVDYSTIDLSYVFNDALWDRYFFSTSFFFSDGTQITQDDVDAGTPLPNPRMQPLAGATLADLQDPDKAAANLLVQGAFNVNSTSVEAWKALLAGNHQRYEGADGSPLESPFFRFFSQDLGQDNELSSGYSEVSTLAGGAGGLSPLDKLAEAMVKQVKQRGPFASLAEFVNRKRILDPVDDPSWNESGALQAAIDESGINTAIAEAESVPTQPKMSGFDDFTPSYAIEGSSLEGLPGMLSQADVLTAIGPFLTTRSDTFTITSYGEHSNPMNGDTVRAVLEMTVQRMPEYVDSTIPATDHPLVSGAVNQAFGRRFVIVSTRWLDSNRVL
jgi:hypothetical protein